MLLRRRGRASDRAASCSRSATARSATGGERPAGQPAFPYVPVTVHLGPRRLEVEALIDTGFDGDLVVPAALLGDLGPSDFALGWDLADGSRVQAPGYLGDVTVGHTAPFVVIVTVLGHEPLIGRGVISRFVVTLEHGQRVIIEPSQRAVAAEARRAHP